MGMDARMAHHGVGLSCAEFATQELHKRRWKESIVYPFKMYKYCTKLDSPFQPKAAGYHAATLPRNSSHKSSGTPLPLDQFIYTP